MRATIDTTNLVTGTVTAIYIAEGITMVTARNDRTGEFVRNPARNLRNCYIGAEVWIAPNGVMTSPTSR